MAATDAAHATSGTWTATSNGNWTTPGNWNSGAGPVPGASDTGTFNTTTGVTVTIDTASQSIKSLTFTGSNTGAFTLGASANAGNSLLLTNAGAITDGITNATATAETINAPLVLEPTSGTGTGSYSITNNATTGNTLGIAGGISGGTTTNTITLTLSGSNTGANTLSGPISNGAAAAVAVIKSGVGTWTLSGSNAYTGTTTINDGTLKIGSANALSSSNPVQINETTPGNTATLDLNGTSVTIGALTFANTGGASTGANQIINSSSTAATLTLGGTVTVNTTSSVGALISVNTLDLGGGVRTLQVNNSPASTDLTISSVVTDGTLSKNGAGTLLLSNANTYSGGTTDQGNGVILVGNNSALGTGTVTINSSGAGSFSTLSSADGTAHTLANAVAVGVSSDAAFGLSGTGNLTLGAMTMGNASGSTGTLTVNNTITTVTSLTYNTAGVSGTVTKNGTGAFLVAGNDTLQNIHYDIQGGMFGVAGTMTVSNLNLDGGVAGLNGTYNKGLGTTTGGSVDWSATGTGGGFAAYGSNATWGNAANNLTVNIGNATATLAYGSSNFLASGQTLILGNASSNGTVTFQNGLDFTAATQTIQVDHATTNTGGGYDAVLTGPLTDGGMTKTGAGILEVTGNSNTYAGGTTISGGTFYANNTSGSATGSGKVSVGSTATLAGKGTIAPTSASGSAIAVADGGNITPGDIQPAPINNYTANSGRGPSNPGNGSLILNPTNVSGGALLSVGAGTVANPSLTFAIGNTVSGPTVTHSDSEIVVSGSAANTINFNANGTGNSIVAINDLVMPSLQLNTAYELIKGNGSTTFEDNGSAWSIAGGAGLTAFSGSISNLSGDTLFQITGGLALLPANTPGNFFSQWYSGSVLIFDATNDTINVEVVPEPGTWALMLGGLALLVLWQKRRNAR